MGKHKQDDSLDAFGHLTWTVGFCAEDEADERGDWLACFDFVVRRAGDAVVVEYHVVVDSDSGGFTDTLEHKTVPAEDAPFDLPLYWMGISRSGHGVEWTGREVEAAHQTNDQWNAALQRGLACETPTPASSALSCLT